MAAMAQVMDPELQVSLVKAGMVSDILVAGSDVKLKVTLTTPACPLKDKIRLDVETAIKALPGIQTVQVEWGAQVRRAPVGVGREPLLPSVKNVIVVGAGKGGVGKSTVALNMALGLVKCGAKVGLLDADFYGPSIPVMTGIEAQPVSRDGKKLEPIEVHGLKVMSIGFLVAPNRALIWRGPMLHGAVTELVRDVNWGELDYLVLDLPPGTGDVVLSISQMLRVSGAVLVTTPQDVALADVIRAKEMFDKVRIPVLGLVENMSQFICPHCGKSTAIFHHGGGRRAAEMFQVPFLGEIPLELSIREGGDAGQPVVVARPDSAEAAAFIDVAKRVAGRVSIENARPPPALEAAG
jgi:ATP-binding protein involved in chromosome partitioning